MAIVASGCGGGEEIAKPFDCQPLLTNDIKIRVDEKHDAFPMKETKLAGGPTRITVDVPIEAKNSHGVAIDGGVYKNVAGAGVKPGRASSLTISLTPGKYTIYDPVAKNRDKGYVAKLVVGKSAPPEKTPPSCLPTANLAK